MPWLINAAQCDKFRKSQKNVVILDASWHTPDEKPTAYEKFLEGHIPGARFIDLNAFVDTTNPLPNMLSMNSTQIEAQLGALGVTPECKIIFYDRNTFHPSCRALWMFKVFGHNPNLLYIIDGGFAEWEKFGGKIESGVPQISPKTYSVQFNKEYLRTLDQMKANLREPKEQIIDVRHAVRFAGGPEARPGLRTGHIPDSFSFPFMTLFENNGYWKPLEKIRKQLIGIGIDLNVPITTTCGSGMTAPILNFALDLLSHPHHAVYDGSWSEWSPTHLYPGETSLAERPVETCLD